MSDAYYQDRARRRTRKLLIVAAAAAAVICAVAGLISLLYDACTKGFDRSPTAIVAAYAQAIATGNQPVAQECWEHQAYYDLAAGCSEICLSKLYGAQFEVTAITPGSPVITPANRANLAVAVTLTCRDGQARTGEVLLDSVAANAPWRHWAIVHSTLGGTVVEPWCK